MIQVNWSLNKKNVYKHNFPNSRTSIRNAPCVFDALALVMNEL